MTRLTRLYKKEEESAYSTILPNENTKYRKQEVPKSVFFTMENIIPLNYIQHNKYVSAKSHPGSVYTAL